MWREFDKVDEKIISISLICVTEYLKIMDP